MTIAAQHERPTRPVAFDVEYPERLSRWLIFAKSKLHFQLGTPSNSARLEYFTGPGTMRFHFLGDSSLR